VDRHSPALVFLLSAAACGDRALVVSLPVWGDAIESWIVARTRGDVVEVHATDRSEAAVELDASGESDIELRGYERPLAELRLTRGLVPPPAEGTFPRSLPMGTVQLVTHVDQATVAPWVAGGLPQVAAFQFGVADPCAKLTAVVGSLPHAHRVAWGVALDGDSVLVGSSYDLGNDVEINRIHRTSGVASLRIQSSASEHPKPHGIFQDARGGLWLGDQDGGLWTGTVSSDALVLERVVGPTPHGESWVIAGDPADPRANLFTVTTSGTLARLDRDRWIPLDALAISDPVDPKVGIAWLGKNDVLYGTSAWPKVRRWRALLDVEEFSTNDSGAGITGMFQLPADRVVVSMGGGLISVFDGSRFVPLGLSKITTDILAFAPLGDGFLYAGTFGYVAEWNADVGYCAARDPIAAGSIRVMLPLGDALFVAGDAPRGPGMTSYSVVSVDQP